MCTMHAPDSQVMADALIMPTSMHATGNLCQKIKQKCHLHLPRSLEGADASFWPANVCLFIFPGLRASFRFWVRGLTLF